MGDGDWHQVQQGEWLAKIANHYHISDWRKTIWEHPNNADLAQNRDPNLLYPGDRIFIPGRKPKLVSRPVDAAHEFKVKRKWDEFFLKVFGAGGKPVANERFILDVGTRKYTGSTDKDGELHIPKMDPGAGDGSLLFPKKNLEVPVQMGQMNPGETGNADNYDNGISGLQMRLANLGYNPGDADGIFGPHTRAAVMEFQIFDMGLTPDKVTGQLDDDTRQAIIDKHGS